MAWIADWWNQVAGTFLQGFGITVVGMALVFFTLGLVILAMVLLTRLPWLRAKEPPHDTAHAAQEQTGTGTPLVLQDDDLARVAAIAVAVLRSRQGTTVHRRGKARRGTWKSYGRAHQLGL